MVPIVPVVIVPVLTEHERVDSMLTSFDGFIIDLVVIDNGNHRTWEQHTSKASCMAGLLIMGAVGVGLLRTADVETE